MSTSGAKVDLIDLLHPALLAEAVRFIRRENEAESSGLASLTVEKLQNMTKVSRIVLQYWPPISSCVTAVTGRHDCRHVPQPADVSSRFVIYFLSFALNVTSVSEHHGWNSCLNPDNVSSGVQCRWYAPVWKFVGEGMLLQLYNGDCIIHFVVYDVIPVAGQHNCIKGFICFTRIEPIMR